MSTSGAAGKGAAASGDFASSSQGAGPEAAAHSAAAAAGDVGQGAVASAADAAMAAAEAADTVRFGCSLQASCLLTCFLDHVCTSLAVLLVARIVGVVMLILCTKYEAPSLFGDSSILRIVPSTRCTSI